MGRSIKLINIVWKAYPMVLPYPINRYARLREIRIRKGADRNGHHTGNGVQQVKDRGAALRAKVKPGGTALIADAHILLARALNDHRVGRESRLSAKHATGTLLTSQAVADRDANRLALGTDGELPTTACGEMVGHGAYRSNVLSEFTLRMTSHVRSGRVLTDLRMSRSADPKRRTDGSVNRAA